ncbi:acyltransferase family protein [Methanocella arvoryzae]|uniref:Acyltransferase 3 domain-containing protein n=1 Tax=Methanocella arvoryzae (strain DSM 22066 / NBRC 105507 / MRE50) TaxID=351160 RepID=Q0W4F1_METAR|nr:acyltransferase [Methanocella arvoryzae]CAJ36742.1 conserved hypothetical protein [Methanocella arvoryzae MRE50]
MVEKIGYLDGVRGVAALMVAISHFFYGFYPSISSLSPLLININSINITLNFKPLIYMIIHNPACVPIFFVLSGYVLTYKFFQTNNPEKKQDIYLGGAIKRYPRLMIPACVSIIIAFILLSLGLFYNDTASSLLGPKNIFESGFAENWQFTPNLFDALRQGLFSAYFSDNKNGTDHSLVSYNGVLWTMYCEFTGSLILFAILAIFGEFKYRRILYIPVILIFIGTHYMGFIFGLLLADLFNNQEGIRHKVNNLYILIAVLAICIIYWLFINRLTNFPLLGLYKLDLIYIYISVGLLMFVILSSNFMQWLLSRSLFLFLGKISFSMYLLHGIIFASFSSLVFIYLFPKTSYLISFCVTFLLSMIVVFGASYLYYHCVDSQSMRISKEIYNRLKNSSCRVPITKDTKIPDNQGYP